MEPNQEGHHPREPRRRAKDHPTAGANGHDYDAHGDDEAPYEYPHTDEEEDPDNPKELQNNSQSKDLTANEVRGQPHRLSRRGRGPPQELKPLPAAEEEEMG